MDVKCERCNTEYEFDDALVSGRGTTVKCTNCGHKFKIRRGDGELADDYWNVTTGDGRTLVFTSLRELQRAIQGYLVERTDRLSRGGLPPKPIGQIPELAPFFDQREASKKGQLGQTQQNRKTQDGLGPAQAAVVVGGAQPSPARPHQPTRHDFPPASEPIGDELASEKGKSTLIGTGPLSEQEAIPRPGPAAAPPAPPRPKTLPPPVPAARAPMHTQPMTRPSVPSSPSVPTAASASPKPPPPVPVPVKSAAPPPPAPAPAKEAVVVRPPPAPAPPTPAPPKKASVPPPAEPAPPIRTRSLLAEIEEEHRGRPGYDYESVPELAAAPRRRPVGGFIVAVVVLGGLLAMAGVWAQKNLGGLSGKPTATAPAVDPRVADFLVAGEKALSDGNLDLAKEKLDKASALAEKDPHVLLGLARLAAVRADVPWLKLRLLSPDAADEQRLAKNEVTELAAAARKAADDALAVAPDDPAALRAKIDALRIADDREGARALVPKINASQNQPESAYVLAALDLAEPEPLLWSSIIERLKTASSAETGPGRARAALVYALARSGDTAGAKAEVDRLAAMSRPHPLLALLRAFADKAKPKLDAGAPDAAAPVDAGKAGPKVGGGAPATGIPSDPREMLMQAEKARAKGDYDRARTLYNAAIERNPNDSEAIAGLAAIAYAQRDLNGARSEYKRVLAINPNYLPALIGSADVEWDSGNKDGAAKMYKDIVDRYPEGSYPARAKQRSEGSGG
jgi:predicted Zn finger-like uncharacterized protein